MSRIRARRYSRTARASVSKPPPRLPTDPGTIISLTIHESRSIGLQTKKPAETIWSAGLGDVGFLPVPFTPSTRSRAPCDNRYTSPYKRAEQAGSVPIPSKNLKTFGKSYFHAQRQSNPSVESVSFRTESIDERNGFDRRL